MKQRLSDELRVRHVIDAIKEIESYLNNVSKEEFLGNSEKRFATIKQIEIIGEACTRISPAIKREVFRGRMEKHHRLPEYLHP